MTEDYNTKINKAFDYFDTKITFVKDGQLKNKNANADLEKYKFSDAIRDLGSDIEKFKALPVFERKRILASLGERTKLRKAVEDKEFTGFFGTIKKILHVLNNAILRGTWDFSTNAERAEALYDQIKESDQLASWDIHKDVKDTILSFIKSYGKENVKEIFNNKNWLGDGADVSYESVKNLLNIAYEEDVFEDVLESILSNPKNHYVENFYKVKKDLPVGSVKEKFEEVFFKVFEKIIQEKPDHFGFKELDAFAVSKLSPEDKAVRFRFLTALININKESPNTHLENKIKKILPSMLVQIDKFAEPIHDLSNEEILDFLLWEAEINPVKTIDLPPLYFCKVWKTLTKDHKEFILNKVKSRNYGNNSDPLMPLCEKFEYVRLTPDRAQIRKEINDNDYATNTEGLWDDYEEFFISRKTD